MDKQDDQIVLFWYRSECLFAWWWWWYPILTLGIPAFNVPNGLYFVKFIFNGCCVNIQILRKIYTKTYNARNPVWFFTIWTPCFGLPGGFHWNKISYGQYNSSFLLFYMAFKTETRFLLPNLSSSCAVGITILGQSKFGSNWEPLALKAKTLSIAKHDMVLHSS